MDLRITQNLASTIALGSLRSATTQFNDVSERLATGLRVNRASDGASLFAGQTALRSQLGGISAAQQNTLIARNHLDAAQGGLDSILDNLNKLRQTYLKSLGPDVTTRNGAVLQSEVDLLLDSIDNIANETSVGGNKLLNGSGDFDVDSTDGAFDRIRINNAKFGLQETSRTVDFDVIAAAERATVLTNLDLASTSLVDGNDAYMSVRGKGGSTSVHITEFTSAQDVVNRINEVAGATGVYASSFITSASESALTTFDVDAGDLDLTGGNTFTFTVDGRTVTGTATEDIGGGNFRIRQSDLQDALNSASVGNFTVLGGREDLGAGDFQENLIVRRAGNTDFSIGGFASGSGTVSAALTGTTITSIAGGPATARMISEGASLTGAQTFGLELFQNGHVEERTISIATVDEAGFDAGLSGIADATYLGVNENGRDIFLFEATGDTDAFRFTELSSTDTTARNLGLLSNSGGGKGLATQGMAVLALYSEDFGTDQSVALSTVGQDSVYFGQLSVSNSSNGHFGPGSQVNSIGSDVAVRINGRETYGDGWHLGYSANGLDFDLDLTQQLGAGSFTNSLNRIAGINQTTALDDFLIGFRPVTEGYDDRRSSGQLYSYGDLETYLNGGTPTNRAFTEDRTDGVIDTVSFTVNRQLDSYGPRSGLSAQLTGDNGGREYIGIQSFDISHLGAGGAPENAVGSVSNELAGPQEALSQLRREGRYNLINASPSQVNAGLAIIERAIDETIATKTRLGNYQVQTLDRNSDWLSAMEANISQSLADVESNDVIRDITEFSAAQVRVNAASSILAQANTIPQTLLTLLR